MQPFCSCVPGLRAWDITTFLCKTCKLEFKELSNYSNCTRHLVFVAPNAKDSLLCPPHRVLKERVRYATEEGIRLAPQGGPAFEAIVEKHTGNAVGHRGVWFYDPSTNPIPIEPGDTIVFLTHNREFLARGLVTGTAKPQDYPKYCSGVNSRGILWEPLQTGIL